VQRFVGPVVFDEVFIDAPPIIAVDAPVDEQLDSARAQDAASHGPVIHDGHLQHGFRVHYGDGRSHREEVSRGFLGRPLLEAIPVVELPPHHLHAVRVRPEYASIVQVRRVEIHCNFVRGLSRVSSVHIYIPMKQVLVEVGALQETETGCCQIRVVLPLERESYLLDDLAFVDFKALYLSVSG
jgi:hypothetical protein